MDEKIITERECDLCKDGLEGTIKDLKDRMASLETKFWAIILLLVANFAGVVGILIQRAK